MTSGDSMADSHNHQAKRNARTAKWHLLLKHYLPASLPLSPSLSLKHTPFPLSNPNKIQVAVLY